MCVYVVPRGVLGFPFQHCSLGVPFRSSSFDSSAKGFDGAKDMMWFGGWLVYIRYNGRSQNS